MNTNPGRHAYGPHNRRTSQTRAHDIARSILAHRAEGREREITRDYGVTNEAIIRLIEQILTEMTIPEAA